MPGMLRAATLAAFLLMIAATAIEPVFAAGVELRGAGSTFVAPLVNGWIKQFESAQPDISIRYEGVGSGEGISRFLSGSVDFAGSDNLLSPSNAKKIDGGVVQVPSTAGLIVLAYNLPGVNGKLQLPQSVYADIFLGKIRTWNDPRIQAANKGLDLPPITIAIVTRQDFERNHLCLHRASCGGEQGLVGRSRRRQGHSMAQRRHAGARQRGYGFEDQDRRGLDRLCRIWFCASPRIADGCA